MVQKQTARLEGRIDGRAAILSLAVGFAAFFGMPQASMQALAGPTAGKPTEYTGNSTLVEPVAQPLRPVNSIAREQVSIGNPLWEVPLTTLSATRDRPIFSPSRRPPPPPVVSARSPPTPPPPSPVERPAEPDRLRLFLVGTVVAADETEGIGVFLDPATSHLVRIRTNEGHAGWILRSVQRREAIFERNDQKVTLALPARAQSAGASEQPNVTSAQPIAAPEQISNPPAPGNTWMDGDGRMIAPPQVKK